ncbi:MAG: ABC transporter permease [Alphaproteobacteria bacterium]|nr:ABC transporter permease [Alphaproteobacteria bacterium]MBF0128466.1 ABC transporter permease [Alphaproteobacteria bacterium]
MDGSALPGRFPLPPLPRRLGAVNWLGLWTLYAKEVRRFLKVHFQTISAPVVTTLLFLAVFSLAMGNRPETVGGVPFLEFLAPGLIMMAMVQNAFANTSSSIILSKIQGNIVDVLMPPLSPGELTLAFAFGGVTRGLVVGLTVSVAMALFVPLHVHSPAAIAFHAFGASLMLALLGMIGAIWADKFDHMAAVTNFIVTPLSFLSGTFYSIERLPEAARFVAQINPFFYMIDGFRYGFIGHADGNVTAGFVVVAAADALLLAGAYAMFRSGYKLKA